jgi:hypothetical protein
MLREAAQQALEAHDKRYQVVRDGYWWRVRIGDGTQTVGQHYTKMGALRLAAELFRAFHDGGFVVQEALRTALAQQEQEPTVRFKCTVVDDQHPNGVPFEQWVNAPQQEPVTQMRGNALARWAHEQEEPPDTGWQRDWQRGYEAARRWVRQVGLPSLAQQEAPKGGGNLPPPLQAEPVLVVEKEPDYMSRGHFYEGSKPFIDPTLVWKLPIGTKLYTRPPRRETEQEPVACECHRCIKEKDLRDPSGILPLNMSKMILCAECGNKRCPKASDHMLACTGSNEPGQSGSVYAHPPRREWQGLTDDEISALFPLSLRSDYKPYSFARAIEAKLKEKNA